MNKTKIICTIGPACNTVEKMIELIHAGMSVARLNFSHGTYEEHLEMIRRLKEARKRTGKPLSIMLDTKGPEIRLGKIKDGQALLKANQRWIFRRDEIEGDDQQVTIKPFSVFDNIQVGTRILFDDGYFSAQVVELGSDAVTIELANGGIIRSGKGVNIPNTSLNLPGITEKDIEDIKFGCEQQIDIIAASFVRSAENILTIRNLIATHNQSDIIIIAKIENAEGVHNFDSIIQAADGIMIARGDLGVEVPLSHVPRLQKMMIRRCYLAGKPVVTATQMLESMINNPRPTRAETSDVANAIYDSTSAVMLSGETAIGRYPVETVNVMREIIFEAEADFNYRAFLEQHTKFVYNDIPSAVTLASVKTAYSSNAKAIFTFTKGGGTARLLSRLRPRMPIIAMCSTERIFNQLAFLWGVIPIVDEEHVNAEDSFKHLCNYAIEHNLVTYGDLVVMTVGVPFGVSGTTNTMMVKSVGEVLVRAGMGYGQRVHGEVIIVFTPHSHQPEEIFNKILVISKCDQSYHPLIAQAAGVVLQNHISDFESEKIAKKIATDLGKPIILRADDATHNLHDGIEVTLDPVKSLVYRGVVGGS